MKKTFAIAIALLLCVSFIVLPAFAADTDPYVRIKTTKDTIMIDDTKDQGTNAQPIGWFGDCAVGCTYIDDMVLFPDLEFGDEGAVQVGVSYTNGDSTPRHLAVILDDPKSEPVAIIEGTTTNGWDVKAAKDFFADFKAPVTGKHSVYIKWVDGSGSLYGIQFYKAADAVKVESTEGSPTVAAEDTKEATPTEAPTVAPTEATTPDQAVSNEVTQDATENVTEAPADTATTETAAADTASSSSNVMLPSIIAIVILGIALVILIIIRNKKKTNT